jgi:hypothetical protein
MWSGFIWIIKSPVVGSHEQGNEMLGSIKSREFIE